MTSTATPAALSHAASTAVGKFERDLELTQTARNGFRKATAQDAVQQAKAALRPRESAIIELRYVRGLSIADIARKAKMSTDEVGELIRTAADALARHYESVGAG